MVGIKVNYPNNENIHKARNLVKIDWIKRNEENKDKRIIITKKRDVPSCTMLLCFIFLILKGAIIRVFLKARVIVIERYLMELKRDYCQMTS